MSRAGSSSPTAIREELAAAALARIQSGSQDSDEVQNRKDNEDRKNFRRLCFVKIERENDARAARQIFETLLKLAGNILSHPDEEKYRQFKTTNTMIKNNLVDPKGGLEYAQLGFRADVQNFQPLYVFHSTPEKLRTMRIGIEILHEALKLEIEKDERKKSAKETEKEALARQQRNVLLAYEDDRKTKSLRDKMEKERREAVLKAQREAPPPELLPTVVGAMPVDSYPEAEAVAAEQLPPPTYQATMHLRGGVGLGRRLGDSGPSGPDPPSHQEADGEDEDVDEED